MSILRVRWPGSLGRVPIFEETAREWNHRLNEDDMQLTRAVALLQPDAKIPEFCVVASGLRVEAITAEDLTDITGCPLPECAEAIDRLMPSGFVQCVALPLERGFDDENQRRVLESGSRLKGSRVWQLRRAYLEQIGREHFPRRDRRERFTTVGLACIGGNFRGKDAETIAIEWSESTGVGVHECYGCLAWFADPELFFMCDPETPDLVLHLEALIAGVLPPERRAHVEWFPPELTGIPEWNRLFAQITALGTATVKVSKGTKAVARVIAGLVVTGKSMKGVDSAALACVARPTFFRCRKLLETLMPELFGVETLEGDGSESDDGDSTAPESDDEEDRGSEHEGEGGEAQSEEARDDQSALEDADLDDASGSEGVGPLVSASEGDASASDEATAASALDSGDDDDGFLRIERHFQAARDRNADKWASGLRTLCHEYDEYGTTETRDLVLQKHLLAALRGT
jgi:hypothetical protein